MNEITSGHADCFEQGSTSDHFEQVCNVGAGEDLWCYNDVEVDWMPSGFQQIVVRRGCRTNNWKDECAQGSTGGYYYKLGI